MSLTLSHRERELKVTALLGERSSLLAEASYAVLMMNQSLSA